MTNAKTELRENLLSLAKKQMKLEERIGALEEILTGSDENEEKEECEE